MKVIFKVMRVLPLVIFSILVFPAVSQAQAVDLSPEELYVGGPDAPMIISTDMPSSDAWYRPQEASFHWGLPDDVVAVAADLYDESGLEPMTSYRPPMTSITIGADQWIEGTQYLSVQFRNAEKWGRYAERRVSIDGTPPEPFVIEIRTSNMSDSAIVGFGTVDRLSGLSHYEVQIDGHKETVTPEEAMNGFLVSLRNPGQLSVEVTAYDLAGNARSASTVIYPITIEPSVATLGWAGFASEEPASILSALMAALLLVMFGYMVYERQRYAGAIVELRGESEEAQTQIMRIFNALRSEIYDQINAIDGKTRLSKKEKEAVDGLSKALKVSERLLKKEVKDIKKLL